MDFVIAFTYSALFRWRRTFGFQALMTRAGLIPHGRVINNNKNLNS